MHRTALYQRPSTRLNSVARSALLCVALLGSGWAQAALFGDNEARKAILELRDELKDVRQSQSQLREQNDIMQRSLLNLQGQIESLKQQNAQLTGRVEEVESRSHSATSSMGSSDTSLAGNTQLIALRLDGQDIQVSPAEKQSYDAALRTFQSGDFARAEQSFKTLLAQFSGSDYTPWAYYWIGNSQYALKQYQNALASFRQVILSSDTNPKAPEAALSLANCQSELGQKSESLRTLENLTKVYPHSQEAQIAREKLARNGRY